MKKILHGYGYQAAPDTRGERGFAQSYGFSGLKILRFAKSIVKIKVLWLKLRRYGVSNTIDLS